MRAVICFTSFLWNISHSMKNQAKDYNKFAYVFVYKVLVILVRFQSHLHIIGRFSEKTTHKNFMEIRPLRAQSFFAAGRIYGRDEAK
jgi:diadenosine tetraphosphate (Ap4A) HIT family hydrolase